MPSGTPDYWSVSGLLKVGSVRGVAILLDTTERGSKQYRAGLQNGKGSFRTDHRDQPRRCEVGGGKIVFRPSCRMCEGVKTRIATEEAIMHDS